MKFLLFISIFALISFAQANALVYDNGVEQKVHNCMKAVPVSPTSQSYYYIPCDTAQSSAEMQSQIRQLESKQGGFTEQPNPNTIIGHSEISPEGHVIEPMNTQSQNAEIVQPNPQVSGQPNYANWYWLGLGVAVLFVIVSSSIVHRRRSHYRIRDYSYSQPLRNYTNAKLESSETRVESSWENGQRVDTTIQENREITKWNEALWLDVKTNFPRDWQKILKWIALHVEDVNIIIKNSTSNEVARRRIIKEAWDNLDTEGLL